MIFSFTDTFFLSQMVSLSCNKAVPTENLSGNKDKQLLQRIENLAQIFQREMHVAQRHHTCFSKRSPVFCLQVKFVPTQRPNSHLAN